jgi:hypothetical protein
MSCAVDGWISKTAFRPRSTIQSSPSTKASAEKCGTTWPLAEVSNPARSANSSGVRVRGLILAASGEASQASHRLPAPMVRLATGPQLGMLVPAPA